MKLYVADYLGDTHHLAVMEHGAYLLLLMAMWRAGGSLPSSDAALAKIARCTPEEWALVRDCVLAFFTRSRSRLSHKRLSLEIAKYDVVSRRRSEAGKWSRSKKPSENNGAPEAIVQQMLVEPEPEPEPERKKEIIVGLFPEIGQPSEPPVSASRAPPKGSRLKPDWVPSTDNQTFALAEGFTAAQVDRIAADFRDFWLSKAGKDAAKMDWSRTWQRWVRNTDRKIVSRSALAQRVGFV